MKEIVIGGRSIFYNGTLNIRDGEVVELTLPLQLLTPIGGEILKVSLQYGALNEQSPGVSWKTIDGVVKFTLTGWRYGGGAALDNPVKFGSAYVNGQEYFLWFDMSSFRIGEVNFTHLTFSRGHTLGK